MVVQDSQDQAEHLPVTSSPSRKGSLQVLRVAPPAHTGLIKLGNTLLEAASGAASGVLALRNSIMNSVSPPRNHQHTPDASARQQIAACSSPGPAAGGQQPTPITRQQQPASKVHPRTQQGIWHGREHQDYASAGASLLPMPGNTQHSLRLPNPDDFSGVGGLPLPQNNHRAAQGSSIVPSLHASSKPQELAWRKGVARFQSMLPGEPTQKPRGNVAQAPRSSSLKVSTSTAVSLIMYIVCQVLEGLPILDQCVSLTGCLSFQQQQH